MAVLRVDVRKNVMKGADRRLRRALYGVTRRMAEDIAARAKDYILINGLVDTGDLYRSVVAQPMATRKLNAYEVVVGERYGIYHEYGTRYMPARPFLTPAVEDIRPFYEDRVRQAIERSLSGDDAASLDAAVEAAYFGDAD